MDINIIMVAENDKLIPINLSIFLGLIYINKQPINVDKPANMLIKNGIKILFII